MRKTQGAGSLLGCLTLAYHSQDLVTQTQQAERSGILYCEYVWAYIKTKVLIIMEVEKEWGRLVVPVTVVF